MLLGGLPEAGLEPGERARGIAAHAVVLPRRAPQDRVAVRGSAGVAVRLVMEAVAVFAVAMMKAAVVVVAEGELPW